MMESESEILGENREATASSMLVAAREALGLSQKDVARELYLSVRFISYIDAEELSKIPKQAFVRGYLRSYAKIVKLDGDLVVAQYNKSIADPNDSVEIRGLSSESVGSINFTGPVFQTGLIGLAGLALVIAAVWLVTADDLEPAVVNDKPEELLLLDNPAPVKPFQQAEETNFEAALPAESWPVFVNDLTLASSDASTLAGADNPVTDQDTAEAGEETLKRVPLVDDSISIDRDQVGDTNFIVVEANGDDELNFIFTDDCWLEIQDGNGKAIFGDLGHAGDDLTIYGVAPFEVLFGMAPAVTMAFNGENIDLNRRTSSDDTAMVRVGN